MATTTSNGHARTVDDTPRVIQSIQGSTTPDHVVPRLVGMGMPVDEAMQLADQHDEQRIIDALDAVEELGDTRRVMNPVGWVRAAVRREWDLTGVLATRRENERRLAALDLDREERQEARVTFPAWRAISERWDRAISAALDDDQLERAVANVARPVPGIGRHSIPVTRAELIAWAVEAHGRSPHEPLTKVLTDDLDRSPRRQRQAPQWPLPEPPSPPDDDVRSLTSRITGVLTRDRDLAQETAPVIEVAVPHRTVRFGQDLER